MTYTQLALLSVPIAIFIDLYILKTKLVKRKVYWASYAIIVFFQLVANGVLTGAGIVEYSGAKIIGSDTPQDSRPPFLGDGRIAYAPVEDLLFGYSMILLTLALWVWWGKRGVQREPLSGPPRSIPGWKRNR